MALGCAAAPVGRAPAQGRVDAAGPRRPGARADRFALRRHPTFLVRVWRAGGPRRRTRLPGVRIDLHTHSNRSDGTDSPAELVRRAHAEGIDVLALTDHDTTEGWQEALDEAERTGVTLVRGIEVSCRFAGYGVHLLAYLPDPTYRPLQRELRRGPPRRHPPLPPAPPPPGGPGPG